MVPVSELQRARKYPFSSIARNAVRQLAPSMNDLSQESFETALGFVEASSFTSPKDRRKFVQSHFAKRDLTYPAFLTNDVLAFPLAKILLSYVRNPLMYDRFASVVGDVHLFDVRDSTCREIFGFGHGDRLLLTRAQDPKMIGRNVTIIGVRDGMLWKIDDGAVPLAASAFQGCVKRADIVDQYEPRLLNNFPPRECLM